MLILYKRFFRFLDLNDLMGGISGYNITVISVGTNNTVAVNGSLSSYVVTGLLPNTDYAVGLRTIIHGGSWIDSDVVYVSTLDGGIQSL